MGSIITLGIDKFEIEWGKNNIFNNHSNLFQKTDIKKEKYYYANNYTEIKDAYSAPLRKVKKRLDMLGYSLTNIQKLYRMAINEFKKHTNCKRMPSFKQLYDTLSMINLGAVKLTEEDECNDHDFGKYFKNCIAPKLGFNDKDFAYDFGEFYENLDPYIIVRLLAENHNNMKKNVIWCYQDIVDGGYVSKTDIYQELNENNKFLIVTEGTSDLFIIEKCLKLFHPEIIDFFSFIDMQDNYPFTGSGNLYKFIQGLSKIHPVNNVLAIFDNDTEGNDKYEQSKDINLPHNIKIVKLPTLKGFQKFKTIGPSGMNMQNINGCAVAIECFLDLKYNINTSPIIRWTSYNNNLRRYQGVLENKDNYVRQFKKATPNHSAYDFAKLISLTDTIINHCIELIDK